VTRCGGDADPLTLLESGDRTRSWGGKVLIGRPRAALTPEVGTGCDGCGLAVWDAASAACTARLTRLLLLHDWRMGRGGSKKEVGREIDQNGQKLYSVQPTSKFE
jgi:hypothetical protein